MPVKMNILRDKRLTTKILILLELSTDPHLKHKTLAEKFDMTVQAVSDYFKIMKKEGLVTRVKGRYKPTQKGILFLHSNFSEIRDFLDDQMHKLNIIDICTAIAGGRLRPGDRVGLFMEKGELNAYKNRSSSSMGIVVSEADKGDDVAVKELDGIVALDMGEIHIIKVPTVQEGGTKAVPTKEVKRVIRSHGPDRIAAMGTVARVLLKKMDMANDIEFSMVDSTLEACQKGLKVLVVGEEREINELINRLNDYNATNEEKIEYSLETFPKKGRSRSKKRP
jgi:putative transcriptional regulator